MTQVQRRLGFVPAVSPIPGTMLGKKKQCRVSQSWASFAVPAVPPCTGTPSCADHTSPTRSPAPASESLWHHRDAVVSRHGDRCPVGSWVFADDAGETIVGRIEAILMPASAGTHSQSGVVILQRYSVDNIRHPHYNMPQLIRTADAQARIVVQTVDILFIVNVQHNCREGKCLPSGHRARMQERVPTTLMQQTILHTNDTHFILNLHALHNAALIRKALPRHLTAPIPYLQDREAEHSKMASSLRTAQNAKRAKEATARKERATARAAEKVASEALNGDPLVLAQTRTE